MRNVSLLGALLGVAKTVMEQVKSGEDAEVMVAHVRPVNRQRGQCGACRRRSPKYDAGAGWCRWRILGLGAVPAVLEADAPRAACRRHGVIVAAKCPNSVRVADPFRVAERVPAGDVHDLQDTLRVDHAEFIAVVHANLGSAASVRAVAASFVIRSSSNARAPHLAPRELDVLSQVALGCSYPEMAQRLSLKPGMVKSYMRTVLTKLDYNNQVEAVVAARRKDRGLLCDLDVQLCSYDLLMVAHSWALKNWYFAPLMSCEGFVRNQTAHLFSAALHPDRRQDYSYLLGDLA